MGEEFGFDEDEGGEEIITDHYETLVSLLKSLCKFARSIYECMSF